MSVADDFVQIQRNRDQEIMKKERKEFAAQQAAVKSLSAMVDAYSGGDFSERVSLSLEGSPVLLHLADCLNKIAKVSDDSLASIREVVSSLADSCLDQRIEQQFSGLFGEIVTPVNETMQKLVAKSREIDQQAIALSGSSETMLSGIGALKARSELQSAIVSSSSEASNSLSQAIGATT